MYASPVQCDYSLLAHSTISREESSLLYERAFFLQLFFGYLGDKMGRKRVYGVTLLIMIVCSICSGLSMGNTATSVITTLCFFRFWLGFGIGGDYPLSATIMSEYANTRTRGGFIAAVFAMQVLFLPVTCLLRGESRGRFRLM